MPDYNKEMQQRKNCELYAYVLAELGQDIPDHILECAMSDEYPVDCVADLAKSLEDMGADDFERIVYDKESALACDLAKWWTMYLESDRLRQELVTTCL
jgi:hypothetical protein